MRLSHLFMTACLLIASLAIPPASRAAEPGKDYVQLAVPLLTTSGNRIEVAEFFWYRCPHCFELEPALNDWIHGLPRDVAIRRIPAVLNETWAPQARAWYTLKLMGVADKYHDDLFNAIHLDGLDSSSELSLFAWAGRMGMNPQTFANTYHSFAVQTKVTQAAQLTRDSQITGVPSFVVDGRYVTSVAMTGSEQALFKTLDELIARVRSQHARSIGRPGDPR